MKLTKGFLKEHLKYFPDTGVFKWLKPAHHKSSVNPGDLAGGASGRGYLDISLNGKRYRAHRLAWFYMTGEWPEFDIDHINGKKNDNRWDNLRLSPNSAFNAQNIRKPHCDQKLGVLGVYPHGNGYCSKICADGKKYHLGTYATIKEASAAYIKAKRKYHAGCTI